MTSVAANSNLFVALRAGFPDDLDRTAIETVESGLCYTWRDLERATAHARQPARLARAAAGAPHRGAGREVGRGAAALPGRAARRLRLPAAQHRLPERRRSSYFLGNAEPARGRLQPGATSAGSASSPSRRHAHVFTLGDDRSGTCSSAPRRYADALRDGAARRATTSRRSSTPAAPPGAARAPCSRTATCCSNALTLQALLGLAHAPRRRRAGPRAADLPRARPLRRAARRAARRQRRCSGSPASMPDARSIARLPDATVFMGVPTLYVRLLAEPRARPARPCAPHAPVRLRLGAAAAETFSAWTRAHRPPHPRALRHERDRAC